MKILIDTYPEKMIILTGSSSFDIITIKDENIEAYECKWKDDKASFVNFLKINGDTKTCVVNNDNFTDFGV